MRADLGYPPLVTPLSQMVGVQATVNVLLGERYKSIGKEIKSYIHGEYGRAPGKVNEELAAKVLGGDKPITGRYADSLEPEFPAAREHLGPRAKSEEDVLLYRVPTAGGAVLHPPRTDLYGQLFVQGGKVHGTRSSGVLTRFMIASPAIVIVFLMLAVLWGIIVIISRAVTALVSGA